MISKYSVRKPMTVLVAVILVIVLGVVSFTRMTPDLLPSLDFPYVIVVTAYPGASPEKIEGTITKPIEQASATLDNIESISSNSNANYSMVMLEFADDANMDACTMNLREKLDQLAASWPEMVSTPTIIKINPNMLPVGIAAVSRTGYDTIALSDFVQGTLKPRLEGIEGVASVSLNGIVSEEVNVIIRQEKIDALNERIRVAVDGEFAEAEQEIADGEDGLNKAGGAIGSARRKINAAEEEANAQFDGAQAQIDSGKEQLTAAIAQLDAAISAGESYSAAQYEAATAALSQAEQALAAAKGQDPVDEDLVSQLSTGVSAAKQAVAGLEAAKQAHDNLDSLRAQRAELAGQLAGTDDAQKQLDAQRTQTQRQLADARKKISSAAGQVKKGREQLADAKEQLADAKLDAYDASDASNFITMDMVSAILGAQDFYMPAGYVTEDDVQWLVYVGDVLQTAEELNGLMLLDMGMDDMEPIYLNEVADVIVQNNADKVYARVNGADGVTITFSKQSNYATATASDNIAKMLHRLEGEYEGLSFITLMDQGDYIHLLVNSVLENLLQGAALAILILLLFLWDIRPTFIVACSIPISVTFAIVLMYFSGVTLNIISMSGLAVGVGMLVDNSIVVIENIYRLRRNGVSVYKAAISGAAQVTGAITSSTLTTVCVFLPIVFVQGMTRQLFQDMALTIGYSLMASLIVALTLIPAMSGAMLKKDVARKKKGLFDRIADGYAKILPFFLKYKVLVILVCIALLGISAYTTLTKGFTYMPEMDTTQLNVTIEMLDEESTLKETSAVADTVYERIKDLPGVETVGVTQSSGLASRVGLSAGDASVTSLSMYVVLSEDKELPAKEIAQQIEALCADLPATVSAASSGMDLSSLTTSGISLNIYGDNLEKLQASARGVAEVLRTVPGVLEVSDGMEETTPVLKIVVDKEKAMKETGMTTAQIYQEVAKLISNSKSAASIEDTGNEVIVYSQEEAISLQDILNMTITTKDKEGEKKITPLKDIVDFQETETLQAISRSEQRRYIRVSASIQDGYNVTLVTADAKEALQAYELPEGFTLEFKGENETIMEAMEDLVLMLLLGVVIVYLIMVAQFQSLLSPFIVMLTIPLAFTGGLFALNVSGFEVSIVAMIGFVLLVGIIVNNGIVLIDTMNRLRISGMERKEAVIEASRLRMRPVLMTALTTILGLVPLAFGFGMGADMVRPVAVVSIGGLLYATLMTLFFVPVMYDAWCKKQPRAVSQADLELVQEDEAQSVRAELEENA